MLHMLTPEQARDLTDAICRDLGAMWEKIVRAWEGQAHKALGYGSWQAYCSAEFDTDHLALPRSERPAVVGMLRNAGMSTREIAAAVNVDRKTIQRDAPATNVAPEPPVVTPVKPPEVVRPAPPLAPRVVVQPPAEDEDEKFTKALVERLARDIYRFAGMYDPATCVKLREALEPALQRLDKRIKAGG